MVWLLLWLHLRWLCDRNLTMTSHWHSWNCFILLQDFWLGVINRTNPVQYCQYLLGSPLWRRQLHYMMEKSVAFEPNAILRGAQLTIVGGTKVKTSWIMTNDLSNIITSSSGTAKSQNIYLGSLSSSWHSSRCWTDYQDLGSCACEWPPPWLHDMEANYAIRLWLYA